MTSKRRDCRLMMGTTVLHGGVCHRTSTPHKTGNKMKKKKIRGSLSICNEYLQRKIGDEDTVLLLISASPIKDRNSGFSISIRSYNLRPPPSFRPLAMSSLTASINLLLVLPRFLFPGSSILSILLLIPIIFPPCMSKTSMSCLSCLFSHQTCADK